MSNNRALKKILATVAALALVVCVFPSLGGFGATSQGYSPPAYGASITPLGLSLTEGQTKGLTVTIGGLKSMEFEVKDETVAQISSEKLTEDSVLFVTGMAGGSTEITAKFINQQGKASHTEVIRVDVERASIITTQYKVTISKTGEGNAYAAFEKAAQGAVVTLKQQAAQGWTFDKWEVVSGGITVVQDKWAANDSYYGTPYFTMPANDVHVRAVFTKDTDTDTSTGTGTNTGGFGSNGKTTGTSNKGSTSKRDTFGASALLGNPLVNSNGQVDATAAVSSVKAAIASAKDGKAVVNIRNASEISLKTMQAMVAEAKNSAVTLKVNADTVVNNAVTVRMSFDPSKATKDLALGAALDGSNVQSVKANFAKYYSNEVAVVRLNQPGDLGMPVHLAVKVDTSKLDTKNLRVYSYSTSTTMFKEVKDANPYVDVNGYVHADITTGGYVLFTDRAMTIK